jgi:hypothetical protein
MIWFLVIHPGRPPLRFRRFRVLGISFSAVVRMVDLLLGLDLFDPALGEESAIDLLNGLEAQKEELSTLLPVPYAQRDELLRRAASTVGILVPAVFTGVGGRGRHGGVGSPSLRTSGERIGDARNFGRD